MMLVALQNDFEAHYEEITGTIRTKFRHRMQDEMEKDVKGSHS